MLSKLKAKAAQSLSDGLPWLLLIGAVLVYALVTFLIDDTVKIKPFLQGIASSILGGGVFAVILKTIQFWGVFKEELIKLLFEAKYLENRVDLPEYWTKVTMVLFKDKFPKINKQITNDVKETYLPTSSVQYYDNNKHYITIKLIDPEEEIVEVEQTSKFTIIPVDQKEFKHKFKNTIVCGTKDRIEKFELLKFKVNDKDTVPEKCTEQTENRLITTYDVTLKDKSGYTIEMVVRKQYSLKYDRIVGQINSYIRNNYSVTFHLTGVNANFLEVGTLKTFQTNTSNESFIVKEYNGIIYPKQGYLSIIHKN